MLRWRAAIAGLAASVAVAACIPDASSIAATTATPATTSTALPSTLQPSQIATLLTLPLGAAVCDAYVDIVEAGVLQDADLSEISGIAVSRHHPGVLWAHNDSFGGPIIYALSTDGTVLARWELDGASSLDWEDISTGPGPDPEVSYLYVGDIGDNVALRPDIQVFRFPEPDVASNGTIADYETFRLRYPEPGLDAEALAVDPVTGDLVVITKDRDGPEIVFVTPAGELRDGVTTRLTEVARLELGRRAEVTAADFSPAGERIALRGYNQVWIWPRTAASLAQTFATDPCRAASPDEVQGEALAFDTTGVNLYTISEGAGAAVNRIGFKK